MGIRAVLATLPYKIKQDAETELYRKYMARCARVITENTAKLSGGGYITIDYDDIISPAASAVEEEKTSEEIISSVKDKLGRMAN